jgi:type II secretory pathway component GspD/PulD (secretin)
MHLRIPCGRFVISILLCTTALAGEATQEWLQLPPQIDLANLITVVGEHAGVSVHFAPQKISGSARLDIRRNLSPAESWAVLNQILLQHGFTTVVAGQPRIYHVVPFTEAEASGLVFQTPDEAANIDPPPGFVTVMMQIQHVGPEILLPALSAVLGSKTQARAIGKEQRRLIIAGERERVLAAGRIVTLIDQPGNQLGFRTYQPRFASSTKLQGSFSQAWSSSAKVAGRQPTLDIQLMPDGQRLLLIGTADDLPTALTLLADLDRAEPSITKTYRSENFRMDDIAQLIEQVIGGKDSQSPRLVRDHITGGLIITATEAQHDRIQRLLDELAAAPAGSRSNLRSFVIKYRPAADLAVILRDLIAQGAADSSPTDGTHTTAIATAAAPAADTTPPPTATSKTNSNSKGEATFTVDPLNNSLIVLAQPRLIDQISRLIDQLDRRQPQVQIEVTLVILSDNETQALGVEWASIGHAGRDTFSIGQLLGLGKQGSSITDRTPLGTGLVTSLVNPGDYAVLLQALRTVNNGRNMVTTMTVADNNAEATIDAVVQQPISNINANNNVATTTYGGTSDAGTQIKVKPLIGAADTIQLTYSVSQSAFIGESITTENGGVLPPTRRQDALAGVATIPDGHVIALGGLSSQSVSDGRSGIPYLMDAPLFGGLFTSQTRSRTNSRFFLFMHADVLRHPLYADLKHRAMIPAAEAGIRVGDGLILEPRFLE